MTGQQASRRVDKKHIRSLLASPDFLKNLDVWRAFAPRQAINPLLSFLCSTEEGLRWHAVTAAGIVTATLAEADLESARVIVRRFLWHLNDESGGIGWGIPEAMGEALARSPALAHEYGRLVLSFVREDENYLEHEPLLTGALWALARLVQAHPKLLPESRHDLIRYSGHPQALFRALALWGLGAVGDCSCLPVVKALTGDASSVRLYRLETLENTTVARVAQEALSAIALRENLTNFPAAGE
ncbi:MAG: DVU0298 family protein [Desulfosoma sp.]|uniref:DVU0298 family protein n=1 Tax=Desulfosoma sp. TaxID=2603217 RepID=UPI00404B8BA5